MAVFNPNHVVVGPGTLYAAPIGTTEVTTISGAWPAGWTELGYCVDAHTEILTRRGWFTQDQVTEEDECLGISAEDGLARWQPILKMNRFEGDPNRPMIHMTGQSHDSLTTPNHRWLVDRRATHDATGCKGGRSGLIFTTTDSFHTVDHVPCAAPVVNLPTEAKYTDALVELVAWWVTEGSLDGRGITLYQSESVNPTNCALIRAALTTTFGPAVESMFAGEPVRPDKAKVGRRTEPAWREGTNKSSATFHLNQWASEVLVNLAPNKVLSADFICSLTQAQLRLLLDTAIKGDGWRGKFLAQMSKERIDPFQMVASLAGLRTSLRKQVNNGKDYWTLNVFAPGHESFTARRNTVRENVVHDGMIWCPTTPTHTWLARRDGHVFFTGNTDQGTTFTFTPTFQEITVEEEYWPIRQSPSGAKLELKFMLAEVTAQNLEISLNDGLGSSLLSGSNGTNGDGSIWVEPPTIGTEVRLMLGWDSLIEGSGSPTPTGPFQRLIVRQALQTGAVEMQHKKGNAKTMYACTFSGEKPPNLQPFRLIFPAGFAA